jgi:hypothetical protein
MTQAARQVLADCRIALKFLEEETDLDRWRVHWAGAVALVRAVGHVLHKVDGQRPHVQQLANSAFKNWKSDDRQHEIFREFIEAERNNILKQYQFSHHPLDEVAIAVELTLADPENGQLKRHSEVFELGENVYRPIIQGYREGDDARDVYQDALDWWDAQLNSIDARIP